VERYRIGVPDRELERLRLRLADARWPDRETVEDWSQGVPLQVVRDLCDYWRSGYDWRATEQRVNRWQQYLAVVDGVPIHLFHLPSSSRSAVPLILTHGWPGSFFEFEQVMPQLSDPVASVDASSPAFHVVVPSLPGYGFSGKPTRGWDVHRIARAWVEVMRRLGYDRFIAAGSDWGTSVSTSVALQAPERLIGLHLAPPLVPPAPRRRHVAERLRAGCAGGAGGAVAHRVGLFGGAADATADHRLLARRLTDRAVRLDP
jgi:pimeloyl-ACP methyl ester carboxylesterase